MSDYDEILPTKNHKIKLRVDQIDEVTPLIGAANESVRGYQSFRDEEINNAEERPDESDEKPSGLVGMITVLLIGVFVSQADGSLVLAAYGKVSSEFDDLENGSWLFSAYVLAMCVTQPLYGKLSDIYGRKMCLQVAYTLFALGTACTGLGQSMGQVIAARAVQGAGGAGMVCMVSILLTDLVPLHEVALYRSYVNIAQTVGRSCGGAVGGYIVEAMGWRWAFLCQCPLTVIAIGLVGWKLHIQPKPADTEEVSGSKLKRIDWAGAVTLSLTILSALLVVDMGGQKYAFSHPVIISAIVVLALSGPAFLVTERYYAKEPIFPLHLLSHYVVVTSFIILFLQNFAQTALMMIIPIYFQVTKKASTAVAGAYLIPAVFGNTVGGLLTGVFIKRTGRYKIPTVVGALASGLAFTSLLVVWRGNTTIIESFLIFPGGFATGVAHSAVFIGLTSGVHPEEVAIAGSGLYLSGNVGAVAGSTISSVIYQYTLQHGLWKAVEGLPNAQEIVHKALSDLNFIQKAGKLLRQRLVPVFVHSVHNVFFAGLACAAISLCFSIITREKRLKN